MLTPITAIGLLDLIDPIEPVTAQCLADASRVLVGLVFVTGGCLGLAALAIVAIVSRRGWAAVAGDVLDYVEPVGDVPNLPPAFKAPAILDLNDPCEQRRYREVERILRRAASCRAV